jgi:hypothetical protein
MQKKITHWGRVHPSFVFGSLGLAMSLISASLLARALVPVAYVPLMVASYLAWIFMMLVVCSISCECNAPPPKVELVKKVATVPLILIFCLLILLVASCLLHKRSVVLAMGGMQVVLGVSIMIAAVSLKYNRFCAPK